MNTSKRDEPAQRPSAAESTPTRKVPTAASHRGAPHTYAAHAVRKDITVRVRLSAHGNFDADELREHGYGHGV